MLCPKIMDIKFFVTRAWPLTTLLSHLLSGWLSHCLSSHCRLPPTSAFASHCTAASHRAPLMPLVWLVVTSLLVTPPCPVRLRLRLSLGPSRASCPAGCHITSCHTTTASRCLHLCLSLCCRLSMHPSYASCLAGCCVTSCHAATSHQPAPPPLLAPLLRFLSGWLLCCLLSHRRLPSTCTSASHCAAASHHAPLAPLFRLFVASPLVTPPSPVCLPSASHCITASHHAPLAPLVWLVVALPLVTPPPPISLRLCLSGHCRVLGCCYEGGGG